jgi:hypothetical protein
VYWGKKYEHVGRNKKKNQSFQKSTGPQKKHENIQVLKLGVFGVSGEKKLPVHSIEKSVDQAVPLGCIIPFLERPVFILAVQKSKVAKKIKIN